MRRKTKIIIGVAFLTAVFGVALHLYHNSVPYLISEFRGWKNRDDAFQKLIRLKDLRVIREMIVNLGEGDPYRGQADDWLVSIGSPAVEPLIAVLENEYSGSDTRGRVVMLLGKLNDSRAVVPLVAALHDRNTYIRELAAIALGELKDPQVTEAFITALDSEKLYVRDQAVYVLRMLKDPRAVDPLITVLKDEDPSVRKSVVWTLGQFKDPRAVDPLITVLKDEDPSVRKSVVWTLGQFKDPRVIDPLIAALGDIDSDVRWEAQRTLVSIGSPAVEPLIFALNSKDHNGDFFKQVVWTLGKLKDPRSVDPLIAILKDTDPDVWGPVAEALGVLKDPRSVDPLIAILKDTNFSIVRENVTSALVFIGAPAVQPVIVACNDENSGADAVLSRLIYSVKYYFIFPEIYLSIDEQRSEATNVLGELRANYSFISAMLRKVSSWKVKSIAYAFIGLGDNYFIQLLVSVLDEKGDEDMATIYLNCGQSTLEMAAKEWARKHGYRIYAGGKRSEVTWGGE